MLEYLLEFALVHSLLLAIYKLLLNEETQLGVRRAYLLGATIFALVLPIVELPSFFQTNASINITETVLSAVVIEPVGNLQSGSVNTTNPTNWLLYGYLAISFIFLARLILGLFRIYLVYRNSKKLNMDGQKIYINKNLRNCFSFFGLIFINKEEKEIMSHETAHVAMGHSFDLLVLNLLTIVYWWSPSVWFILRELRYVHEYQADQYALQTTSLEQYKFTLISNTLKNHGLHLTNSFNDAPLNKRLDFMKKISSKIRLWKVVSILTIPVVFLYTFSCQSTKVDEIKSLTSESESGEVLQVVSDPAQFPGGMTAFIDYMGTNIVYPKKAVEKNITGNVYIEFIVNKDGSISDVKSLRGIGFGCDDEAVRVVENSPKWTPAKNNGIAVRQKMVLPVMFVLKDEQSSTNDTAIKPEYPGGIGKFAAYISENLKYPEEAKEKGVEGRVFVEVAIDKNGSISSAKVLKGIGHGCDQESLRVIKSSANWTPAINEEGQTVASTVVIPISFKLP